MLRRCLAEGRLAHAYLIVGPRGVGKGTLARDFAAALNCPEASPPCGECSSCRRIFAGQHPDVKIVAPLPSKLEVGIDQIREVIADAYLPPYEGKYKVFIIDPAEKLSTEAANCFLKTLEEPPPRVVFLLLTSQERSLPPTLLSRCQRLPLSPLPPGLAAQSLREKWGVPEDRAQLLARLCHGCLGLALREEASHLREIWIERLRKIFQGRSRRLDLVEELLEQFEKDRELFFDELDFWQGWWRDMLLVKLGCPQFLINFDRVEDLKALARRYSVRQIKEGIGHLGAAVRALRLNANPRLVLEVLMLDLP